MLCATDNIDFDNWCTGVSELLPGCKCIEQGCTEFSSAHQTSPLQDTHPDGLRLQKRNCNAVVPSQDPPVSLDCPTDVLPTVVSARQGELWLDIELHGLSSATTVELHMKWAPHRIIPLGEHLSKAGPLAKHKHIRVQVSERVTGVSAHSGRWSSDVTAVQHIFCTRYCWSSSHDTLCMHMVGVQSIMFVICVYALPCECNNHPFLIIYAYAYTCLQTVVVV